MWTISAITTANNRQVTIFGGLPNHGRIIQLGDTLGPAGASYMLCLQNFGCLLLKDVGTGPNGQWAVQVNNAEYWYYSGEGHMNIAVLGNGTLTITGGSGPVQGMVLPVMPDCDAMMSDPVGGYCFCIKATTDTTTKELDVLANAASLIVTIVNPLSPFMLPGSSMVIQGPGGIIIDKNSPSTDAISLFKNNWGVLFARIKNPVAGTWNVTVTNTLSLPGYLYGNVNARNNNAQSAQTAYTYLPYKDKSQIQALGFFTDVQATAALESMNVSFFISTFDCAICKGMVYLFAVPLAAYAAEISVFRTLTVAAANQVIHAISDLLDLEPGVTRSILEALETATNPLEWPRVICRTLGQC